MEKRNNISKEIRNIKMAMGAKDVTAQELAALIGINRTSIGPLLNGKSQPKKETLDKMFAVFKARGAVFSDDGVTFPEFVSNSLEGDDWFFGIQQDMLETLSSLPEDEREVLIYGGNNQVSPPHVIEMFRKLHQSGVRIREMIEENDTYIHGHEESYRWISSKNYNNYVTVTYANKVVLDIAGDNALMIINDNFAACERDKFKELFKKSKPLTIKSTAHERYI